MTVSEEELKKAVNVRESMRILAIKTGKYAKMCRAYSMRKTDKDTYEIANPGLKNAFDSEMMPLLQAICKGRLGDNPHDPAHPVRTWKGGYR